MNTKTKNLILVLAVVGVAGYFIFKPKKTIINGDDNSGGDNGGVTTPSQQDLLKYKKIANDLFEAMSGCGTTWSGITGAISKIKSEADWQGVINAYGTRTISSEWWCIGNSNYSGGLEGALRDELSSGEVTDVNKMLSDNGVISQI